MHFILTVLVLFSFSSKGHFSNGMSLKTSIDRKKGSFDGYLDEPLDNPEFDALFPSLDEFEFNIPPPPKKLQLYVNLYLDKNWKEEFGNRFGKEYAMGIMEHAKQFWRQESLDTKIDLLISPDRLYNSNLHLRATKSDYYDVLPGVLKDTVKDEPTVHVYLTVADDARIGLAQMNGMCYSSSSKPRIIVNFKESVLRTAMTVAHELGHLLGMKHDFNRGKETCAGNNLMNYGDGRNEWSECSKQDFKLYYDKVYAHNQVFCLKEPSECACNGEKDVFGRGNCDEGALGQYCYVNENSECNDKKKDLGGFVSLEACTNQKKVCPEVSRICECVNKSECEAARCEVHCKSDCNDKFLEGERCFSKLACSSQLLFELDCQSQTRARSIDSKPVDCAWGQWTQWSSCTVSCGGGEKTATRTVAQIASFGGSECSGEEQRTETCGNFECPAADPCDPNPCGPNEVCRGAGQVATCSCDDGYVGSPPVCLPSTSYVLYSSGEMSEYQGSLLGLYDVHTRDPLIYKQMGGDCFLYQGRDGYWDRYWYGGPEIRGSDYNFYTYDLTNVGTNWWYGDGTKAVNRDPTIKFLPISHSSSLLPNSLTLSSTGPASTIVSKYLGTFPVVKGEFSAGRPIYKNINGKYFLVIPGISSFVVSDTLSATGAAILSGFAPTSARDDQSWQYWTGTKWADDMTIKLE